MRHRILLRHDVAVEPSQEVENVVAMSLVLSTVSTISTMASSHGAAINVGCSSISSPYLHLHSHLHLLLVAFDSSLKSLASNDGYFILPPLSSGLSTPARRRRGAGSPFSDQWSN